MVSLIDSGMTSMNLINNRSHDERLLQLELNSRVWVVSPALAYVTAAAMLGLIGNFLTILYCRRHTKSTPTALLIIAMACVDLTINLVVIPGDVFSMLHQWLMMSDIFCKCLAYLDNATFIASAMMLMSAALVRSSKCLNGFKKMNLRNAKVLCVIVAVTSLVFATPFAFFNKLQEKYAPQVEVTGFRCSADAGSVKLRVSHAILVLVFVACSVPTLILYALMGCRGVRRTPDIKPTGTASSNFSATKKDVIGVGCEGRNCLPVVTPRSRSYIKKKTGERGDEPKDHQEEDSVDGKQKRQNAHLTGYVAEEDNVIEYLDDSKGEDDGAGAKDYHARLIRATTGEKVMVNLSMVRELTIKLKAVQRQTQGSLAKPEGGIEESLDKPTDQAIGSQSSDNHPDLSENNHQGQPADQVMPHIDNHQESGEELRPGNNNEITTADSNKLVDDPTGEDLHNGQAIVKEAGEKSDSNGPSDFAKAMNWVDITYCPPEARLASEGDDDSGSAVDAASLMKKGSFMSSRKVSRDNSFLRKHRKLREALTDTLTRARKSKKDREEKNGSSSDVRQGDRISEDVNDDVKEDHGTSGAYGNATNTAQKAADSPSSASHLVDRTSETPHDSNQNESSEQQNSGDLCRGHQGRLCATTRMLIIVTLIYILAALPFLTLTVVASDDLETVGAALRHVFIRSHYLSSALKPVVYAIFSQKFRGRCC